MRTGGGPAQAFEARFFWGGAARRLAALQGRESA